MRLRISLGVLICLTATAAAQRILPKKDLAFAHAAVAETFETVITVTNRGTYEYAGTFFFRSGSERENEPWVFDSVIWNPAVNGQPVTNGEFAIPNPIQPGATQTFRITGNNLSPNMIEVGTVILYSTDLVLDNFIEGNLTYFVTESGAITDSVGILPSTEFYLGSLPFDDFSATALALGNGDAELDLDGGLVQKRDARVQLRLYDEDGLLVATKDDVVLGSLSQVPRFLSEFFPLNQPQRGKVEIASLSVGEDFAPPLLGTAITFKANEFSSLPLEPSPVAYTIRMDSDDADVLTGELALWAEGYFVKGYLVITTLNGEVLQASDLTVALVSGELIDGALELSFFAYGAAFFGSEVTLVMEDFDFAFEETDPWGSWAMLFLDDFPVLSTLTGTYQLTKITP